MDGTTPGGLSVDLLGVDPGTIGATGLLAVVVLLVLAGRLIPRSTYLEMRRDRDTWREAAEQWQAANAELVAQNGQLIELSETGVHVLKSLPRAAGRGVSHASVDQASPGS